MIDLLDRALRALLLRRVPDLTDESQVRFQPPDEQWRASLANMQVDGEPALALSVYLTEIRQNRQRRSTARQRTIRDGEISEQPAPTWVDCHYLISAWSPAASQLVEPTPDEHALLYRVLAALQDAGPINPTRVYPTGSEALTDWPPELRDVDLPTELMPVEGFGKLAEFWATMGTGHRWKPVLQFVVGLPVVFAEPIRRGLAVATVTLRFGPRDARDVWVRIGGHVRRADGEPLHQEVAEVSVVDVEDDVVVRATRTDPSTGRFVVDLPADAVTHPQRYRLRATLGGSTDAEIAVDLRSPSHDLTLSG